MKQKLFTLLLAVAASIGTMFAWDYERVQIGDLYYNLDATNQTAEVTSQNSSFPYWSTSITTANIPLTVTYNEIEFSVNSIGDMAFETCGILSSVTIPNSVTSIGIGAFRSCDKLSSVTIGSNVTSIGHGAFQYCSGLISVTIPSSVSSIGDYAFAYCSGLTSIYVDSENPNYSSENGVLFNKDKTTLVVYPGGKRGTYIIPNSVIYIGDYAFYGCPSLDSVAIPNSVTSIGVGAFFYCGLTSVTIPNSVTSIGNMAFRDCKILTSIEIPNSVTNFGDYVFSGCINLPVENNIRYADTYLVGAVDKSLSSYSIKEETRWIGVGAFRYCNNMTSVTIPDNVTNIGTQAFADCSGLSSVTIGNSVTIIGEAGFQNCSSLTSVTIPDNVTNIGTQAFENCTGMTSVKIGNGVTCIGYDAFFGCSGLTSVTIGNHVTIIEGMAFFRCIGLTSVTIPNSVTSIGGSAFSGCSGLTSVTIPNSVTSIGGAVFYGCSGLTSVEAPAGFFDVPEENWPYYTKILNHITINGGELTENALLFINRSYKTLQTLDVSGVTNTEFADEAFKGYYNLQQLVLPEGLQKVSYMMVAGCKNLQSIDIPASVEEIEQSAFEDCRSIKSITFGGSSAGAPGRYNATASSASQLRRIGNWAFYNAHELQHLDIPEGVTEIGDGAFYGCTYLEDMTLPASIQAIGDNCFALCAKLTKITCNAVTPPIIQAKTFFDVKRQTPVYVPDEAVSAYENDTYWQEFDIQGISNMPMGIDNTTFPSGEGRGEARKILRDGQIFIFRGDKEYTLTGQEVK